MDRSIICEQVNNPFLSPFLSSWGLSNKWYSTSTTRIIYKYTYTFVYVGFRDTIFPSVKIVTLNLNYSPHDRFNIMCYKRCYRGFIPAIIPTILLKDASNTNKLTLEWFFNIWEPADMYPVKKLSYNIRIINFHKDNMYTKY